MRSILMYVSNLAGFGGAKFTHKTHKDKKKESHISVTLLKEATPTFPQKNCSIIGAGGLNFSVRNGKRWDPTAIVTKLSFVALLVVRLNIFLTFIRMR